MLETDVKSPPLRLSMAMSPQASAFAPLVFAGRLEAGIAALAESAFAGVEISLRHVEELDEQCLADWLSEHGLKVSAFASGRICLEESLCLCNPRRDVRKKLLERLTAILKLAARFDAPLIIGGVRGKLSGDESQKARQRAGAVDTLRRCAMIAHELGTHLLVEPINRYETNFINTAQEGLDFIEEIGQPAVKLLLDTFHMNIEESDLDEVIYKARHCLGYLHFADNNRLVPGLGHIDFPALIRTLMKIGYSGFISAEILPLPDDATALRQAGLYLHALIPKETIYPTSERS